MKKVIGVLVSLILAGGLTGAAWAANAVGLVVDNHNRPETDAHLNIQVFVHPCPPQAMCPDYVKSFSGDTNATGHFSIPLTGISSSWPIRGRAHATDIDRSQHLYCFGDGTATANPGQNLDFGTIKEHCAI